MPQNNSPNWMHYIRPIIINFFLCTAYSTICSIYFSRRNEPKQSSLTSHALVRPWTDYALGLRPLVQQRVPVHSSCSQPTSPVRRADSIELNHREKIDRKMTSAPDWLNAEFLQTVLRSGEDDPTATVTGISVKSLGGKGDGYASAMYRVTVDLTRQSKGETRSLIVKNAPSGGEWQDFICTSTAFPREIHMFSETLPEMYRLLNEASPGKYPRFSAKYYYSRRDPEPLLVIEDLTPRGYKMADRSTGLDLEHCKLVLRTLAHLHAASVALYLKNPASMKVFDESFFCEATSIDYMGKIFKGMIRSLAEEVETWPDFGKRYADKINKFGDTVMERLSVVTRRDETSFNVLTHTDLWVKNILFRYSAGNETPDDCKILDFQIAHFTSPAIDLQYFLITSPTEEVRIHHQDQLIREYHEALCDALADLGCSAQAPSLQDIHQEFDSKDLHGFFVAVTDLALVVGGGEVQFQFDSFSGNDNVKSGDKTCSVDNFKQIMKRLLPIFESKGLI